MNIRKMNDEFVNKMSLAFEVDRLVCWMFCGVEHLNNAIRTVDRTSLGAVVDRVMKDDRLTSPMQKSLAIVAEILIYLNKSEEQRHVEMREAMMFKMQAMLDSIDEAFGGPCTDPSCPVHGQALEKRDSNTRELIDKKIKSQPFNSIKLPKGFTVH